ncbi:MAG: iron-containing alcohol dehydrogenase [Geminicoccaceae bacterium]
MIAYRADWSMPTQIRFGAGRIDELPGAIKSAGMVAPLMVTDPGLAALPVFGRVTAQLEASGVPLALFKDVKPNPTDGNVEDGVAALREGGHDGVIGVGGGSALDLAKVIAFMIAQERPLADFEDRSDWWRRATTDGILPVIAVPTTAGTGSEVGRAGVITDEASRIKRIIFHPQMLPAAVIADPELTIGLPPTLTAWTGMDALAHCFEAYSAPAFNPVADGIALEGMRLIKGHLIRAFEHGDDLDARSAMMAAASMGAIAFQKGLGAIHSLSHPIGAMFETHHGLTNAVLMPHVLGANRNAIAPKLGRLCRFLDLDPNIEAFQGWISDLLSSLGIPRDLGGIGVDQDMMDAIAEAAPNDPTAPGNPVPVTEDYCRSVLSSAFRG